jgi:hypothetical protein
MTGCSALAPFRTALDPAVLFMAHGDTVACVLPLLVAVLSR